jgi:hypothetical protein
MSGRGKLLIAAAVLSTGLMGHCFGATITAYDTTILANNPYAYFSFNEAAGDTTVADSVASPNFPGTVVGGVTLGGAGMGDGGTSAAFNGSSGIIRTSISSSLGETGSTGYPYTIEGWFKTGSTAQQTIAGFENASLSSRGFFIGEQSGKVTATVRLDSRAGGTTTTLSPGVFSNSTGGFITVSTTAATYADSNWHYVAAVFSLDTTNADGNTSGSGGTDGTPYLVSVYVDPTSATPALQLYHAVAFATTNYNRFSFGAFDRSSPANFFNGSLDDFALYNTALSGQTIFNDFQASVPEPASFAGIVLLGGIGLTRRRRRAQ